MKEQAFPLDVDDSKKLGTLTIVLDLDLSTLYSTAVCTI